MLYKTKFVGIETLIILKQQFDYFLKSLPILFYYFLATTFQLKIHNFKIYKLSLLFSTYVSVGDKNKSVFLWNKSVDQCETLTAVIKADRWPHSSPWHTTWCWGQETLHKGFIYKWLLKFSFQLSVDQQASGRIKEEKI